MPPLDRSCIRRVVEVAVRQQQPVHLLTGKPLVSTLRGVKKDVPARGFEKICVRVELASCKWFELIHLGMV